MRGILPRFGQPPCDFVSPKLGISEPTFSRYLRKELPSGLKEKVLAAIEQVKREHEVEQKTD